MKYIYEYEIQHQEVDSRRRLRLFTLENYLLNVGGRVADELGYGIQYLNKQNLTWVLTRMSIEMNYMPAACDKIAIETWVESNAHMLSTRDYRIYLLTDDERHLIGCAKSVWTVLDLTKREIVSCFDTPAFAGMVDSEVLDLPRAARMQPITEPDDTVEHKIQYSDVDYNGHCNSCKYLEIMLNAKLPDIEDITFRVDINYSKEVYLNDSLFTHYIADPLSVQYVQKDVNGTTCCSAQITILDDDEWLANYQDAVASLMPPCPKKKEDKAGVRPTELECDVVRFQNNKDKWIAFVGLKDGMPYEIFTGLQDDEEGLLVPKSVSKGKIIRVVQDDGTKRYDFQFVNTRGFKITLEGLSYKFDKEFWNYAKLISGVLRYGMPIDQVIKMINGLQMDSESINSWKVGVERALKKYLPGGNVDAD